MTRTEIELSALEFLTPEQAAGIIGCNPYAINVQAKEDPAKLGFPVCVMGTRVRIPRRAFLRWLDGGAAGTMTDEQVRAEFDRMREALMRELDARISDHRGEGKVVTTREKLEAIKAAEGRNAQRVREYVEDMKREGAE